MANNKNDPVLCDKVVRLHLEERRTIKSLTDEYKLGSGTVQYWLRKHHEEYNTNPQLKNEKDQMLEIRCLRKELEETKRKMNS